MKILARPASLAGILIGLLSAAAPAAAQTVGSVVSGTVEVAGKQVPLPAGDFTVLSVDNVPARLMKGGETTERLDLGPIRSVTLAQVIDGRAATVVEVAANLLPYYDGWGPPPTAPARTCTPPSPATRAVGTSRASTSSR